jgi:hypothetical protein
LPTPSRNARASASLRATVRPSTSWPRPERTALGPGGLAGQLPRSWRPRSTGRDALLPDSFRAKRKSRSHARARADVRVADAAREELRVRCWLFASPNYRGGESRRSRCWEAASRAKVSPSPRR